MEDGKLVSKNIPKDILKRMVRAGILEPFQCVETCPYEPLDVELVKAVREGSGASGTAQAETAEEGWQEGVWGKRS